MAKLTFGPVEMYTPSLLVAMDTKELETEYNRLRGIALKRLAALERSEFSDSQTYLYNRGRYTKTAAQMISRRELLNTLSDLGHFIGAKTGSVRGLQHQRKLSIEQLHRSGYTFVNRKNFKAFTDFMEAWRDEHPRGFGSPTPSELAESIMTETGKRLNPSSAEEYFKEYLTQHGQSDLLG